MLDTLFSGPGFQDQPIQSLESGRAFYQSWLLREDLAAWLWDKLRQKGIDLGEPYQEDWGWGLPVKNGGQSYYLGAGGNADGSSDNRDEG